MTYELEKITDKHIVLVKYEEITTKEDGHVLVVKYEGIVGEENKDTVKTSLPIRHILRHDLITDWSLSCGIPGATFAPFKFCDFEVTESAYNKLLEFFLGKKEDLSNVVPTTKPLISPGKSLFEEMLNPTRNVTDFK